MTGLQSFQDLLVFNCNQLLITLQLDLKLCMSLSKLLECRFFTCQLVFFLQFLFLESISQKLLLQFQSLDLTSQLDNLLLFSLYIIRMLFFHPLICLFISICFLFCLSFANRYYSVLFLQASYCLFDYILIVFAIAFVCLALTFFKFNKLLIFILQFPNFYPMFIFQFKTKFQVMLCLFLYCLLIFHPLLIHLPFHLLTLNAFTFDCGIPQISALSFQLSNLILQMGNLYGVFLSACMELLGNDMQLFIPQLNRKLQFTKSFLQFSIIKTIPAGLYKRFCIKSISNHNGNYQIQSNINHILSTILFLFLYFHTLSLNIQLFLQMLFNIAYLNRYGKQLEVHSELQKQLRKIIQEIQKQNYSSAFKMLMNYEGVYVDGMMKKILDIQSQQIEFKELRNVVKKLLTKIDYLRAKVLANQSKLMDYQMTKNLTYKQRDELVLLLNLLDDDKIQLAQSQAKNIKHMGIYQLTREVIEYRWLKEKFRQRDNKICCIIPPSHTDFKLSQDAHQILKNRDYIGQYREKQDREYQELIQNYFEGNKILESMNKLRKYTSIEKIVLILEKNSVFQYQKFLNQWESQFKNVNLIQQQHHYRSERQRLDYFIILIKQLCHKHTKYDSVVQKLKNQNIILKTQNQELAKKTTYISELEEALSKNAKQKERLETICRHIERKSTIQSEIYKVSAISTAYDARSRVDFGVDEKIQYCLNNIDQAIQKKSAVIQDQTVKINKQAAVIQDQTAKIKKQAANIQGLATEIQKLSKQVNFCKCKQNLDHSERQNFMQLKRILEQPVEQPAFSLQSQRYYNREKLFNYSSIMGKEKDENNKHFLIERLSDCIFTDQKQISSTKLIFRYKKGEYGQNNLQKLLVGRARTHLVTLIKCADNSIIAVYAYIGSDRVQSKIGSQIENNQLPIQSKHGISKKLNGLIITLQNKKIYELIQYACGIKSISKGIIIFGNNDLVVDLQRGNVSQKDEQYPYFKCKQQEKNNKFIIGERNAGNDLSSVEIYEMQFK